MLRLETENWKIRCSANLYKTQRRTKRITSARIAEKKQDFVEQEFTHLQHPMGPCSYDKSTAIPNHARDQSTCCRFVSFEGCFAQGMWISRDNDGPTTDVNDGIGICETMRRMRKENKAGRKRVQTRRKCRSARNWGGGWRATGLHAAPRRPASLNIRLPSSFFSSSSSSFRPTPASWNQQPTRQQATLPTSNSNLWSLLALEATLGGILRILRGVPYKNCDRIWICGRNRKISSHLIKMSDIQRYN